MSDAKKSSAGPSFHVMVVACLVGSAAACGTGGTTGTSAVPDATAPPEDAGDPDSGADSAVPDSGACTPGDVVTEDCGNCGKRKKTCSQASVIIPGACTGEPANGCKPGTVDFSSAGCVTPGTSRNRTCGAGCLWGSYSATCAPH